MEVLILTPIRAITNIARKYKHRYGHLTVRGLPFWVGEKGYKMKRTIFGILLLVMVAIVVSLSIGDLPLATTIVFCVFWGVIAGLCIFSGLRDFLKNRGKKYTPDNATQKECKS